MPSPVRQSPYPHLARYDCASDPAPLRSWEFARLESAFRRTPPGEPVDVVGRSTSARGRPDADVALCRNMLSLIATTVRHGRVADLRYTISQETYENTLKVEIATDRLLDDINGYPWH